MAEPHLRIPELSQQDVDRFWSKVAKRGPDDCWEWTAGRFDELRNNYGAFKVKGRNLRSHRVAFFIASNTDPGELLVCHTCDNPPCCNPSHLFLGTTRDNADDCGAKGRHNPRSGDEHGLRLHPEAVQRGQEHWAKRNPEKAAAVWNVRLNPELVRAIRREYEQDGQSQIEIGKKYGVHSETVGRIIRRRSWKHVT
jgi:hypothetical protein